LLDLPEVERCEREAPALRVRPLALDRRERERGERADAERRLAPVPLRLALAEVRRERPRRREADLETAVREVREDERRLAAARLPEDAERRRLVFDLLAVELDERDRVLPRRVVVAIGLPPAQ
jgi:hypothetical protein